MLKAGEAKCAITPMNGMTVLGYVSRNGKESMPPFVLPFNVPAQLARAIGSSG